MKLTRRVRTGSVHYSQLCQVGEEGGKKGVSYLVFERDYKFKIRTPLETHS